MTETKLILMLSENITLFDPQDHRAVIDAAVLAERCGFDGVMVSEHVVLGAGSDANGIPEDPRTFVEPGNQSPAYPWPSSLVLMSAMAAVTSTLRIVAGAVIAPLRHPLLLAKELGTLDQLAEGRLVVIPNVSWHRSEYDALGVSFAQRGRILDEQLEVMRAVWTDSPVSHHGEFFDFDGVYVEPKAYRPGGPKLWFGGATMHPPLVQRLLRYGSGVIGFGRVAPEEYDKLADTFAAEGRGVAELERAAFVGGRFSPTTSASVDEALDRLRARREAGTTTFCLKPAHFIDRADQLGEFMEEVVAKTNAMTVAIEDNTPTQDARS